MLISRVANQWRLHISPPYLGFKFSMIQLLVGTDKSNNLQRAGKMIREAASMGANVIALPVSN